MPQPHLPAPASTPASSNSGIRQARDHEPSTSLAVRLVALLVASLPLMMASHILINHFLEPRLGSATFLVYPEVVAAVLLLLLPNSCRPAPRGLVWRTVVAAAFALGAWFAVCALVQQAPVRYWPRRLAIEWVVGPLLGISFARHLDTRAWRLVRETWLWTSLVGAVMAIVLYVISVGVPRTFKELVFDNRTYYLQFGLARGVYFGELTFGGVNDIACYYGIVFLVYWARLLDGDERWTWRLPLLPCVLTLEYLCYSRGVLLGMAAGATVLAFARLARQGAWPRMARGAVAACVAFAAAVVVPDGALAYWRGQLTVDAASTAALRVRMWSRSLDAERSASEATATLPIEVVTGMRQESDRVTEPTAPVPAARAATDRAAVGLAPPTPAPAIPTTPVAVPPAAPSIMDPTPASSPQEAAALSAEALRGRVAESVGDRQRRLLFGYGTGNYGLLAGATPDFGVHNLFLEAFVAGGALGLALFIVLWAGFVWRAYGWAMAGGGATAWSALAVAGFLTFVGAFVSVRFENLGTYVLGTIFWLIAAGPYGTTAAKLSAPAAQDTPSASL